jgi:hypothetical protein
LDLVLGLCPISIFFPSQTNLRLEGGYPPQPTPHLNLPNLPCPLNVWMHHLLLHILITWWWKKLNISGRGGYGKFSQSLVLILIRGRVWPKS